MVAGDQATGDVEAEIGGQSRSGNTGNFWIFKEIEVQSAQPLRKREENIVSKTEYARALGIGTQKEDDFMKADKIGGVAKAGAAERFEQLSGTGGSGAAELA